MRVYSILFGVTFMRIIQFIKIIFCNHADNDLEFVRNIGGDEMMQYHVKTGLAKSKWYCNNCGRDVYKNYRKGDNGISSNC